MTRDAMATFLLSQWLLLAAAPQNKMAASLTSEPQCRGYVWSLG